MAPRRRSNPLSLAVLACLSERPMHPYEMGTTMRSRGQDQTIKLNYGSLYTVVESLARAGLIEARETEREGRRPERTVYSITEAGRREFVDWLSDLLRTPAKEYSQFAAGLTLMGGLPPADVTALLEERGRRLEFEVARLTTTIDVALDESVPRVFLVEVDHQRAICEADLEFTRKLALDIASGSIQGIDEWCAFHAHDAAHRDEEDT
jgi:DNA-binding PadR family transcriptional regulator